jgi:hypothetical protein
MIRPSFGTGWLNHESDLRKKRTELFLRMGLDSESVICLSEQKSSDPFPTKDGVTRTECVKENPSFVIPGRRAAPSPE